MKKNVKKILVADDSVSSRMAISGILEENGYEVIEAGNGKEALEAVEKQSPDCIVLDLLMPVMDGIEALTVIRGKGNNVPVIVLTADIQDTTRDIVEDLGVSRFINKPLRDLNTIVAAVDNIFYE